jgi:hypothetical protein
LAQRQFALEPNQARPLLASDHRGLVVMASAWLALYVVAVIHEFIASGYWREVCPHLAKRRGVQSTDKDTTMTLQASSPSLFAPAREGRERSFWRQLLGAIMEGRQRKADEYIRDYLRRHRGERPDEFRIELERRLLGQSQTGERDFMADAAGNRIQSIRNARTWRYRGRRRDLVGIGVKLPFFDAPLAEGDARYINSVSVDVSPLHHNIETLPVQKFHDMSLVFPVVPDGDWPHTNLEMAAMRANDRLHR